MAQPAPLYFILLWFLGLVITSTASADEFINSKQLLNDNKPEQAYKILTQQEAYHMGEPDYDQLLAKIALQLGHAHEAIFAYERILINQPGNINARIGLAVAYFQINELETSREIFDSVLKMNMPANIRQNIDEYIHRIDEKIGARRHSLNGQLSLKQGWDSNINSATNESEIQLNIGTYRPEANNKETADTFTELVNWLHYNYNANINSRFFSSLGYTNKDNNNKNFDTQTMDARVGYSHTTGFGKLSIPVSYQTTWLDEKQLRDVLSISTSLNRATEASFTDYSIQYGEIRYRYQPALNVDLMAASFAYGLSNKESGFNQQYAVFYGDETATNDLYRFNARKYWGVQMQFPIQLSPVHIVTPKIVYQEAEYHQQHPFFKARRDDKFLFYELGWRWYLNRDWQLQSQASHSRSDSTVGLYTYTRTVISVGFSMSY